MNESLVSRLVMLVFSTLFGLAQAAEHTEQAQEHASEATGSVGDSKAVAEHASEALKHVEAAKTQAADPGVVKHLNQSEADLKSAVKNAERYNSGEAVREAQDAKSHLDAIRQ